MVVDYQKIASANQFYESLGFETLDAPWWVPRPIMKITSPDPSNDNLEYYLTKNEKCLVASGEQSFLYMANKGLLPKGKFQCTTPCFREEIQGDMKRKFFIKNELILTKEVSNLLLEETIQNCVKFFKTQVPRPDLINVVSLGNSYDINYERVELGSYGIREVSFLKWIYATGCAEPRLSQAIALQQYKERENG